MSAANAMRAPRRDQGAAIAPCSRCRLEPWRLGGRRRPCKRGSSKTSHGRCIITLTAACLRNRRRPRATARNCCLFAAWQSARALPYSEPKIGSAAFKILRRADPRLPCGNVIRMAGMKSVCCGELVQSRNHFDSALIHGQSPSTEQGSSSPAVMSREETRCAARLHRSSSREGWQ